MKLITLPLLALAASASKLSLDSPHLTLEERWENFRAKFAKTYKHEVGRMKAFAAFAANDAIIHEHNAKGLSYTLGHNKFSDLTWEEFSAQHLGLKVDDTRVRNFAAVAPNVTYPNEIDWVAKGAVSDVKNQEYCGSCYAFSAVGAIEGRYQIAGHNLTQFSEQDIISCDKVDNGCEGGLMDNVFKWVEQNGLCSEDDYGYSSADGEEGTCQNQKCNPVVTVSGYEDVPRGSEEGLLGALATGPVSVAVEADKSAFMLYKSGILDNPECGDQLNHGILAVGYGTEDGKDYYKVKNSWGPGWGEGGYIRMARGKNQCGIANVASYPTGVKPLSVP